MPKPSSILEKTHHLPIVYIVQRDKQNLWAVVQGMIIPPVPVVGFSQESDQSSVFSVGSLTPLVCLWVQEASLQGLQQRKDFKPPFLPCCPSFTSISWPPAPLVCCPAYHSSFLFCFSHQLLLPVPLPRGGATSVLAPWKICLTSSACCPKFLPPFLVVTPSPSRAL